MLYQYAIPEECVATMLASPQMSVLQRRLAPGSFEWALQSVCREHGTTVDDVLARHQHPGPHDGSSLLAALADLGVEARLEHVDASAMARGSGTWITLLRHGLDCASIDSGDDSGVAGDPVHVGIVRGCDESSLTIHAPSSSEPMRLTREAFADVSLGQAIRVIHRAPGNPDPDLAQSTEPFGLRWFLREMLRHRRSWRDALLASLFVQLLALLVPLLTQAVIDKVVPHRTSSTLVVIAAGFLAAAVFSGALGWIRQRIVLDAGTRVDAVLASDVFSHLLRLPARYFEQRSTGVLVARLHGVESVREFIAGAALTLLLDLPFMIVFLLLMLYYSPTLTMIALGLLALLVALSAIGTPLLRRRIDDQFLTGARHQAFVTERLAGIETVKSLQLEPLLVRQFEGLYGRYLEASVRARRLAMALGTSAQTIEQVLAMTVLCCGAWLVVQGGGLTIGALIAFQMFAARLTAPALRIATLWQEFQQVHVAVRRLADIMDLPQEPWRLRSASTVPRTGRLECGRLGFRYGTGPWLFRGLTFELNPGECVALIGASGSGKSTFARLLQGFYLPTSGSLKIDGVETGRMAANELRSHFGIVPQETRLFSGSVIENLVAAAPDADLQEIVAACRAAGVHDVVAALPDGYFTRLGENGTGLSGGQKQRLAIARALLKRPRILVLDEATSSLDPDLVDAFVETINALRGKVSVLFIGHRLPANLRCDRVVQLRNREERTHG